MEYAKGITLQIPFLKMHRGFMLSPFVRIVQKKNTLQHRFVKMNLDEVIANWPDVIP